MPLLKHSLGYTRCSSLGPHPPSPSCHPHHPGHGTPCPEDRSPSGAWLPSPCVTTRRAHTKTPLVPLAPALHVQLAASPIFGKPVCGRRRGVPGAETRA